jgi:hypothetical protein
VLKNGLQTTSSDGGIGNGNLAEVSIVNVTGGIELLRNAGVQIVVLTNGSAEPARARKPWLSRHRKLLKLS